MDPSSPLVVTHGSDSENEVDHIKENGSVGGNDAKETGEAEKDLVTGIEGDKKRLEKALEEIRKQDTHDLYCTKCTHNVTATAILYEKGKEPFPYNKERFILWFAIIISFKYPFIYLPWFEKNTPAQEVPVTPTPTKPKADPQDVPVITPTKPKPDPQEPVPSSPWQIRSYLRFLLVLVLLLLSIIVLWFPQHLVEVGKLFPYIWPTPSGPSPPTPPPNNSGGLIRPLFAIPLLLLAILALCWPTISWIPFPKPRVPENLWRYIVVSVQEPDILKSIVYGGLIQSMTSLSLVSSAAAAGASILNVLALGAANLFTGFFLICHNLHALFTCRPRSQSPNNYNSPTVVAEEDPYKILLGNIDNKFVHFFVVLASFLFFGVIPPYLFYVLSIKGTDKGHYNAAVVLSGTLVCVIALSYAKAYAFNMEKKLKTVLEYTVLAIGASALSFMVTNQFRKNGFH